jgi:hypothetical protein
MPPSVSPRPTATFQPTENYTLLPTTNPTTTGPFPPADLESPAWARPKIFVSFAAAAVFLVALFSVPLLLKRRERKSEADADESWLASDAHPSEADPMDEGDLVLEVAEQGDVFLDADAPGPVYPRNNYRPNRGEDMAFVSPQLLHRTIAPHPPGSPGLAIVTPYEVNAGDEAKVPDLSFETIAIATNAYADFYVENGFPTMGSPEAQDLRRDLNESEEAVVAEHNGQEELATMRDNDGTSSNDAENKEDEYFAYPPEAEDEEVAMYNFSHVTDGSDQEF